MPNKRFEYKKRRKQRRSVTIETIAKLKQLKEAGHKNKEIAVYLDLSNRTVIRLLKRLRAGEFLDIKTIFQTRRDYKTLKDDNMAPVNGTDRSMISSSLIEHRESPASIINNQKYVNIDLLWPLAFQSVFPLQCNDTVQSNFCKLQQSYVRSVCFYKNDDFVFIGETTFSPPRAHYFHLFLCTTWDTVLKYKISSPYCDEQEFVDLIDSALEVVPSSTKVVITDNRRLVSNELLLKVIKKHSNRELLLCPPCSPHLHPISIILTKIRRSNHKMKWEQVETILKSGYNLSRAYMEFRLNTCKLLDKYQSLNND
ncbi:hypothetical protein ACOME3_009907 [Neoechinorhynchus agilis]